MVYCFDDSNSKLETMTKEQILSAITQAVNNGNISNIDTGFVTMIKEQNRNASLKFWLGRQAEYNALTSRDSTTVYIITDEDSVTSIESLIESLDSSVTELGNRINTGVPEKNKLLMSASSGATLNTQYAANGIGNYQIVSLIFDWYAKPYGSADFSLVDGFSGVSALACIKNTTNNEAMSVKLLNSDYNADSFIRFNVTDNAITFTSAEARKVGDGSDSHMLKVKAVYGVC